MKILLKLAKAPELKIDRIGIDLPEYQGTVEEVASKKCEAAWVGYRISKLYNTAYYSKNIETISQKITRKLF